MFRNLVAAGPPSPLASPTQSREKPVGPNTPPAHNPLERPLAAIRGYKFLIVALVGLAIAGGVVATRLVPPLYEARAPIRIEPASQRGGNGPMRSRELLSGAAWMELLRSFRIVDSVVTK